MSTPNTEPPELDGQVAKAVQTLGLGSPEEFRSYETAFSAASQHLSQLIENAKSPAEKTKHEGELNRLEMALSTVRDHLNEQERNAGKKILSPQEKKKRKVVLFTTVGIGLLLIGGWLSSGKIKEVYAQWQKEEELRKEINRGYDFVEEREWVEASQVFEGVLTEHAEEPSAVEKAKQGLIAIEQGKREEIGQQVTYLLSAAEQAIDDGELNVAQQNLEQALAQDPGNEKAELIRGKILKAKASDKSYQLVSACEKATKDSDWRLLAEKVGELETFKPNHPDIPRYREMAKQGLIVLEEKARRAKSLYERALAMDTGEYSEEALALAEESVSLSETKESRELLTRLSSYTRILKVPAEYPTIAKALAASRSKDRIQLEEGTYKEVLTLKPGVEIAGQGVGKTILECAAVDSSVINMLDGSSDDFARLSQLTVRHEGHCYDDERSPIVLVEGGRLRIDDCLISNSGGHGIAVIEGGRLTANRVTIKSSSWDGISVYGSNSFAKLAEMKIEKNFHHGLDVWSGGRVEVEGSYFNDNHLVGLLISSANTDHIVKGCFADDNEDVGFLFEEGASVHAEANYARRNNYGGFVVRGDQTAVTFIDNKAEKNGSIGIVVSAKSKILEYSGNTAEGSSVKNEWKNATLKTAIPDNLNQVESVPEVSESDDNATEEQPLEEESQEPEKEAASAAVSTKPSE